MLTAEQLTRIGEKGAAWEAEAGVVPSASRPKQSSDQRTPTRTLGDLKHPPTRSWDVWLTRW